MSAIFYWLQVGVVVAATIVIVAVLMAMAIAWHGQRYGHRQKLSEFENLVQRFIFSYPDYSILHVFPKDRRFTVIYSKITVRRFLKIVISVSGEKLCDSDLSNIENIFHVADAESLTCTSDIKNSTKLQAVFPIDRDLITETTLKIFTDVFECDREETVLIKGYFDNAAR